MTKRILFLLVALAATSAALNAQKVALHSAGTVQHFEGPEGLKSAYNASAVGDTIYLPGGTFNVPQNFDKQLTIFGAGHYPDSTQATRKTSLNATLILNENADGFYIEGVDINGDIDLHFGKSVNDVTIKRCRFSQLYINRYSNDTSDTTYSNNVSVIGNVIGYLNVRNARNLLVSNNIISTYIENSYTNQITNNLFIHYNSYWGYPAFMSCDNNYIANNIF